MFVFEVIQGPYKGQAIAIAQGEKLTVGRSGACTYSLQDLRLSGIHAELSWDSDGFGVQDLGSSNGTQVNGEYIDRKRSLRLGDHVQVGETLFQLKEIDVAVDAVDLLDRAADMQGGGMLAFGSARTQVVNRELAIPKTPSSAEVRAPTEPMLLGVRPMKTAVAQKMAAAHVDDAVVNETAELKSRVAQGAQGAKAVVMREGRIEPFWTLPVTIGREHTSGIVLEEKSVSLNHAVIEQRDGEYLIRDDSSSNGIFVNQQRVVEHVLKDGDVIGIGSSAMLVVLGPQCLGLNLQPPKIGDGPDRSKEAPASTLGVIASPGAAGKKSGKKKKKKASELVWYATSDLDRGVFRFRSVMLALLLGIGLTVWMLGAGDSEVLAGNQLGDHHEGTTFLAQAEAFGRDRCTACHIGAGRIATLKCLDCHPDNRPTEGHVQQELQCNGCHLDHLGPKYESAAAATLMCKECHGAPHETLTRTRPQLVENFDRNAAADVPFHLTHQDEGVACLSCHDSANHALSKGIRGSCGQCHAPENPSASDCQLCHQMHPDRPSTRFYDTVAAEEPPRFAVWGFAWTVGLLFLSFLTAGLLPRKRQVQVKSVDE